MRHLLANTLSAAILAILVSCAATRTDQVALCGDERVMIVDMAHSSDTALHVVWDWTMAGRSVARGEDTPTAAYR